MLIPESEKVAFYLVSEVLDQDGSGDACDKVGIAWADTQNRLDVATVVVPGRSVS